MGTVAKSYGTILNPVIWKLLPGDMNLEFNRMRNSKQYSVTELFHFIRLEDEIREGSNLIINSKKRNRSYGVRQNKNNYSTGVGVPNASSLTTVIKPYYFYCNQNTHNVEKCNKANKQKRMILKNQGSSIYFKKGIIVLHLDDILHIA